MKNSLHIPYSRWSLVSLCLGLFLFAACSQNGDVTDYVTDNAPQQNTAPSVSLL